MRFPRRYFSCVLSYCVGEVHIRSANGSELLSVVCICVHVFI